ncbi:hypothetical protein D3C72_2281360 [compost metagenome]
MTALRGEEVVLVPLSEVAGKVKHVPADLLDVARAQADVDHLHRLPEVCERHEMTLEHANRSLIRMLTTSRDQGP